MPILHSPWVILVFIAAGLAVLTQLGVNSIYDFWTVAQEKIWTGIPAEGQSKFTFWHVMFFAWFANMAIHIGMSDMSILKYAKKWQYGFSSGTGMFFGHFIAWMASGIFTAAAAGAVCVVITGWTTANPIIYRADLAFQSVTPNWKRWKVTMFTSGNYNCRLFSMMLLDFVSLYGLILMPMGAVIFLDVMVFSKMDLKSNFAEVAGLDFN